MSRDKFSMYQYYVLEVEIIVSVNRYLTQYMACKISTNLARVPQIVCEIWHIFKNPPRQCNPPELGWFWLCGSRFHSSQSDTSLCCETTDMGLVHHLVCLFTSQLTPATSYTAW